MKKLLITTSIVDTWLVDFDYERLFISESPRVYSKKNIWDKENYSVLPYHWDNQLKFTKDYIYLKDLYERILLALTKKLNQLNEVSYSTMYWRIIIGPWLMNYISILYDKYEQVINCFDSNFRIATVDLGLNSENIQPFDFSDFIDKIQEDEWNYITYLQIIKEFYPNTEIIKIPFVKKSVINLSIKNQINIKSKLLLFLDKFLSRVQIKKKYFFHTTYFTRKKLIFLNILLGQIPQSNNHYFKFTPKKDVIIKNRKALIELDCKNKFEKFIDKYILNNLPIAYIENYTDISSFVNKIEANPKYILTGNAYWSNENFKFWMAKMKNYGCKIFLLDHGGAFPLLYSTFNHEEIISDKFIVWYTPYSLYKHKQVQLPPNKIGKIHKPNFNGNFCTYIGFESVRYGYKICSQPRIGQVLYHFEDSLKFFNCLNQSIKDKLKIRTYPEMGWMTKQRYIDFLGDKKIVPDGQKAYRSCIKNSRLLICSYPQTTFSEALITGIPTILFYNPTYNESSEDSIILINVLIDAKIIFHCPYIAAQHINSVWDSLDEWWLSEKVTHARNMFYNIALNSDKSFFKEWYSFLKSN
jgi:putative transferase (TIGR04331 family)